MQRVEESTVRSLLNIDFYGLSRSSIVIFSSDIDGLVNIRKVSELFTLSRHFFGFVTDTDEMLEVIVDWKT